MLVERLSAPRCEREVQALSALLVDAVDDGAGLGFMAPLKPEDAARYFTAVASEIASCTRVVLVARVADAIVGSAQLDLCQRPNGLHRAECQKVMVHRNARRQGVGRALMLAIDQAATEEQRTTLHLDAFSHQPARRLYASCGWQHAGDIPEFSKTAEGPLAATSIYYRLLPANCNSSGEEARAEDR